MKISHRSPCHDQQLTLSTAYTEHSIHWVLHTPHTASTQDRLSPAPSQSLCRRCCTQFSTFLQLRVDQWMESQLPPRLPPELPPPDWPPPSTPPISFDQGHQWHLQTRSITASKGISKLPWSRTWSSYDQGLRVSMITASKYISKLAQARPSSASRKLLHHGLQVHLQTRSIIASKCICKHALLRPPSAFRNSLNHSLQIHL